MTRTVAEKALQLLSKSVADISGEERRFADALVGALRASEFSFMATGMPQRQSGVPAMEPAMRQHVHGRAVALAENVTVH